MSTCRGISFLFYLIFCPLPYNKCHRTCVVWDPLCRRGTRALYFNEVFILHLPVALHSTTHFLHFFVNLCDVMTFPLCYFSALCHNVNCVQGALCRAYAGTEHRHPTTNRNWYNTIRVSDSHILLGATFDILRYNFNYCRSISEEWHYWKNLL